jgi:SNF2 family DNA or RNA helicase
LTGTPIQNNIEELWTLLNYIDPAAFPSQPDFMTEFGELRDESQVVKLQVCSQFSGFLLGALSVK